MWSVLLEQSSLAGYPSSWVSLPQTFNREWEGLGNCFSVALWVNWAGPTAGINQEVIISRHPGDHHPDGRAHFGIGLVPSTRAPAEWNINAWTGCFIGLGYNLNSIRAFSGNSAGFAITPGVWTHIVLVAGGDGSFENNAVGSLWAQGQEQDSNFWNERGCYGFGIPWNDDSWDVKLGWYQNQNSAAGAAFGFNGLVDEISFWSRIRTGDEIFRDYTFSFEYGGSEPDSIYYQLNDLLYHPYPIDINKKKNSTATGRAAIDDHIGPVGHLVPNVPPQWQTNTGLRIGQRIQVVGKGLTSAHNTLASIDLLSTGNSSTVYTLTSFSPDLAPMIASGQIKIYLDPLQGPINASWLPLTLTPNATTGFPTIWVAANCIDAPCIIIGTLYFTFTANSSPANVLIEVLSPCPSGIYDACGVCNGDNRTCTCLCYNGFRANFLNQQLLLFAINQTLLRVNTSLTRLQSFLGRINQLQTTGQTASGLVQARLVQEINNQRSYETCQETYCPSLRAFNAALNAILPLAEPTGLPLDTCSCDPDPSTNI